MVGLLPITSTLYAASAGTTAANVLKVGVGARAIAMGEAHASLADDNSSLYWNPAGIAYINQSQASFMYNQAFRDMTYNNGSISLSMDNGGLAGGVSYLGYGNIDGYDATGSPTGNVDAYSGVGSLGGGWLLDSFALGFNAKVVHSTLADVKANGGALDLGGSYVYGEPILGGASLRLATVVRNLGPGITFLDQEDPLPTEFRVGTSLHQLINRKLNLGVDLGKTRGEDMAVYTGGEFWLLPMIALRTGYAHTDTEGSGIRAGLGLRVRDLSFDYAYASYGDLGLTHRYELTYRFGEVRKRLDPEERKLLRQAKKAIREERYGQAVLLLDSFMKVAPKYKPAQKLYRTALKGNEMQENLAKGQNNFNVLSVHKRQQETLPDLNDLEQLLATGDEPDGKAAQMKKSSKERKQ
jgi:hypothetical protein